MPKISDPTPDTLAPFHFHGLRLGKPDNRGQCHGECPACGSGKFAVDVASGYYSCYSAGCPFFVEGGHSAGGSVKFLRWLWDESDRRTTDYASYAADRGLLNEETLSHWGVCQSVISGHWLFPAYSPDGGLTQLYKRVWVAADDRWKLFPTPGCGGHAVYGVHLLNADADTIYVAEGPFDGMALWEALRMARPEAGGLEFTGNPASGMLAHCSVLAVANTGAVGDALRRYLPLFAGKRVVLCFDNDHPKQEGQDGSGWAATKRAAGMLAGVAREVCHVCWGDGGWSASLKDGWDIRDVLKRAA